MQIFPAFANTSSFWHETWNCSTARHAEDAGGPKRYMSLDKSGFCCQTATICPDACRFFPGPQAVKKTLRFGQRATSSEELWLFHDYSCVAPMMPRREARRGA